MTLRTLSLALLLAPASALAVDLNDLVLGWTNTTSGQDGSDGIEEARDVVITPANEVIVVGYLDGDVNHGKDAYAINYETDGTSNWDLTIDAGDVTSATLPGSNDRINAIAIEPGVNTMTWCGVRGQDNADAVDDDVEDWFWIALHDSLIPNSTTPPVVDFEVFSRDGSGIVSPNNACTGIDYTDDTLSGSGWSNHSNFGGRWYNRFYSDSTGFLTGQIIYNDADVQEPTVPDQAYAIARNDDGLVAIVGTRGNAGAVGSTRNNTDWYVRMYDGLVLQWEHTFQGSENLEDIAYDVAFDPSGNLDHLVVVGSTNAGNDNTTDSDRNWLLISYNVLGDGTGGPEINWTAQFGTNSDLDEIATSVTYDDNDDIIVGGTTRDPATDNEVWRVAKYSRLDGSLVGTQFWNGPDWGGQSRLNAVAVRDGRVLMAGYTDDGTGPDFAAAMLEIDSDLDGVSDSVDGCEFDPNKADPGVCGCNSPDSDFDKDGVENCIDECPTDPNKTDRGVCPCEAPDIDTDLDGTLDCLDDCPDDPDKNRLGMCGCGAADIDTDGDSILDCFDACLESPAGADIDEFGCSDIVDTGDGGTDGSSDGGGNGGTGCNSSGGMVPFSAFLPLFALLGLRARPRRES